MAVLPAADLRRAVRQGLEEDAGQGDVTTAALFPTAVPAQARIIAQQELIVAGMTPAIQVFLAVDPSLVLTVMKKDGTRARSGETLLRIEGDGRSILTAERVALNFLQHLSGIATLTARFRTAVRGYPVAILDTRKTLPGWRSIQKWAVTLGGGVNHRRSLSDGILIKDNHLSLLPHKEAVRHACKLAKSRGESRTPITVDRLRYMRDYFVWPSAHATDDLERNWDFRMRTIQEDVGICEQVQQGLRSRSFTHGWYSRKESLVHQFHALMRQYLGDEP